MFKVALIYINLRGTEALTRRIFVNHFLKRISGHHVRSDPVNLVKFSKATPGTHMDNGFRR